MRSAARSEDQLGLAIGWVEFGEGYREASEMLGSPVSPREVIVELTYRARVNKWLTLQPDFQYVFNPSGDTTLKNAAVVGLRLEAGF